MTLKVFWRGWERFSHRHRQCNRGAGVPLKTSSLCTVSQLLGVYTGSLLQRSMQAGVLGSVPPVGMSRRAGATALNWRSALGSTCSFEGWVITHTQRLLREDSGGWIAVRRHLWRQTVQLQSCLPTGVTSWRYEAWRLVSVHYGTAVGRSLDLLHVMKPQSVASNKCVLAQLHTVWNRTDEMWTGFLSCRSSNTLANVVVMYMKSGLMFFRNWMTHYYFTL